MINVFNTFLRFNKNANCCSRFCSHHQQKPKGCILTCRSIWLGQVHSARRPMSCHAPCHCPQPALYWLPAERRDTPCNAASKHQVFNFHGMLLAQRRWRRPFAFQPIGYFTFRTDKLPLIAYSDTNGSAMYVCTPQTKRAAAISFHRLGKFIISIAAYKLAPDVNPLF